MHLFVTITGKDGPGIIAGMTKLLYEVGGNIEDASMTILGGEFAMILLVQLPSLRAIASLENRIFNFGQKRHLRIHVELAPLKRERRSVKRNRTGVQKYERYIISVFGKDQCGIVYQVSSLLAKNGLNITDLNSKLIMTGKRKIYGLIIETDIPIRFRKSVLKHALNRLSRKMKTKCSFKPVETMAL